MTFTMAGFIDDQMERGPITWNELLKRVKAEAVRTNMGWSYCTMGKLKAHALYRRDHDGWEVEWDDERVRIIKRRFLT